MRVDPKYTSQRCSVCGHTEAGNRPSQELFCTIRKFLRSDHQFLKDCGIFFSGLC
ncbi:zinc ribbon domain-containing protein [Synechococcus sp. A15-28]|uniref:zinc ribbon domain-containing protein n=1 Tax=Synechococcus sp. A15-28 TaxID=1050638 RepID=UPI0016457E70